MNVKNIKNKRTIRKKIGIYKQKIESVLFYPHLIKTSPDESDGKDKEN